MRSVASVSFGNDSLAMLLLLLERDTRLDEVIFYNSGMEFQAIYDIRDRIKPVLEQRGIRVTEVKPGQAGQLQEEWLPPGLRTHGSSATTSGTWAGSFSR